MSVYGIHQTFWMVVPQVVIRPYRFFVLFASAKNRLDLIREWDAIITESKQGHYWVGSAEPVVDWMKSKNSPAGWSSGPSGFGYGDGDDETAIPNGSLSIYLRKKFVINEKSNVESIILDVDYDDAFVAYINGVEIGRKNIGGNPPSFNEVPFTDHESAIYQGGSPDRITIGSEGILGVITEASMRLQDRPTFRASTIVEFADYKDALNALRQISQSGLFPANCRLLDSSEAVMNGAGDGLKHILILAFESADHDKTAALKRALEI